VIVVLVLVVVVLMLLLLLTMSTPPVFDSACCSVLPASAGWADAHTQLWLSPARTRWRCEDDVWMMVLCLLQWVSRGFFMRCRHLKIYQQFE
jgi:hypothetical protein